ncbi:uncharacterized protein LOC114298401 [Camellia sinensis]|uniref:uncharacterized protein LOC114298401 n=1 Tax=Camellia sinensis TaxID=4442 RepID=UPI0010356BBA|nr:uncharacterized protein LOC114298401 [Camellia sinensis]
MAVDSDGSAEGLLCVWNLGAFELVECCSSRNFLLLSDFNEVRYLSEIRGYLQRDKGMSNFNEFIQKMELSDLPLLGKGFTWCNSVDDERWNRIDRFLLKPEWLEKEANVQGWARYRLKGKLSKLGLDLRKWNVEAFGNIEHQLKVAEEELHEIDLKAEGGPLQDSESTKRRILRCLVWKFSRRLEWLWHQKSKLKWAKDGDKNSRYFHVMASRRQSKNMLDSVKKNGVVIKNPTWVKLVVFRYFSKVYLERWRGRPELEGTFVNIGVDGSARELVANFSEKEVWAAVKDCDGNKASGLDGFNLACIQNNWKVMKDDIL